MDIVELGVKTLEQRHNLLPNHKVVWIGLFYRCKLLSNCFVLDCFVLCIIIIPADVYQKRRVIITNVFLFKGSYTMSRAQSSILCSASDQLFHPEQFPYYHWDLVKLLFK